MLICEIYRSPKKQEMYLYVDKQRGLEDVPEDLLRNFGDAEPVMVLPLSADRKLARADTRQVLESIEHQGYYLQMPPTLAQLMAREGSGE
jgi:hypothetical protein